MGGTISRMTHFILLPLVGLLVLVSSTSALAQRANDPSRWEKDIAAYEAQDRTNPPEKGQIVFIGSSTIRRWTTLASDFAGHKVLNRGFGGSQIADAALYADRIVIPYAPKAVVLRSGGNDLNAGKTPEQVFDDFKVFVAKIHAKLPETQIYYISLSPSIARWKQADKEKALNQMVQGFIAGNPKLTYIETYDMVLGPDGQPRPELFVEDKLHFSPEGYRLLVARVAPHLAK
jgi:lysophospholipase L1-like esterase